MNPSHEIQQILKPIETLDWDNSTMASGATIAVLERLVMNLDVIEAQLRELPKLQQLWELSDCEIDYGIRKFVLYDDPEKRFRLRLHLLSPGTPLQAHDHRASFAARVLSGEYKHTIYQSTSSEQSDTPLALAFEHTASKGTSYFLHHSTIHTSIVERENCLTLMLRGPAVKRSLTVIDLATNKIWDHVSATDKDASPDFLAKFRSLTQADIHEALTLLKLNENA